MVPVLIDLPPKPEPLPTGHEQKASTESAKVERRDWMARSERQRAEVVDRYRELIAEHGDGVVADAVIDRYRKA